MAEDEMDTSVRVALRIRPQIPRELIDACRMCTQVTPGEPQIILGVDKAFTFDHVFDVDSHQAEVYNACVERLVEGALKGYNATVLAYGQTGSGKTFTMGTGFERDVEESVEGIIPRAVRHMFAGIEALQQCDGSAEPTSSSCSSNSDNEMAGGDTGRPAKSVQFSVAAQFMELYNEEIIDLLDPYNKSKLYKIHEDTMGGICVAGATVKAINGPAEALRCLQQGALARTTASTQMNAQSSRSHALFTILIRRQRVMSPEEAGNATGDLETLTSKFHFVDLAGSERLKRTGATGERAREGISINCGLLSLGNVISALGDKSKKTSHVPYRDSKLTRLLQDSLGGNSQTLMIACVSPSDRDFMETLNTLKYANRARNIKNRIQINQDQSSRTISTLRREMAALRLELLEYKQGVRSVDADGNALVTDTFHENAMLLTDNKRMQQRIKAMQDTIDRLTERNVALVTQQASGEWGAAGTTDQTVTDMIGGYLSEIEKLNARLIESEQMCQHLKKSLNSPRQQAQYAASNVFDDEPERMIDTAKRELEREREMLMSRSMPGGLPDGNGDQVSATHNGDDSDSDSESDSEDNGDAMQAELSDLSYDIDLKSKLIEQLEQSQQRMQSMRQHYEDKLNVLTSKIVNTQKERDQVLMNMSTVQGGAGMGGGPGGMGAGTVGSQSNEKIKKVRDEYERKLSDMQREMRKLQSAQKEHIRQQRELHSQENQLKNLKNDLSELKSAKVKLMRRITEESSRHKEMDSRRSREISALVKVSRKQASTIKSLQAQTAAKDQVLKRRTEQVTALRKSQHSRMSQQAAGRVPVKKIPHAFNTRQAKSRWENVQRNISRAAHAKQAVVVLEHELERLLHERKALSNDLANVKRRQKTDGSTELASEEDTLTANLSYIQDSITQVQHSIMEMEDGREHTSESQMLANIVDEVYSIEEAKFLLEKLCSIAIMQTCDIALSNTRLQEREAILDVVQQDSSIQQQLLQHVLSQNPSVNLSATMFETATKPKLTVLMPTTAASSVASELGVRASPPALHRQATFDLTPSALLDNRPSQASTARGTRSTTSSRSSSPVAQLREHNYEIHNEQDNANPKTPKVRRRTAMYQDLLFGEQADQNDMSRSFSQSDGNNRSMIPLARVPSAPGSLRGLQPISAGIATRIRNSLPPSSPKMARKSYDNVVSVTAPTSPRHTRKPFFTTANASSTSANATVLVASISNKSPTIFDEDGGGSPARTPQTFRRMTSREESTDVFSRLGAGTQDPTPGGRIRACTDKLRSQPVLQCTHVVEGHSNSVLSVQVNGTTLYTGSADRTVRVWDLAKATGPMALIPHPGPVVSVVLEPRTGTLYSACGSFVRVWDGRTGYAKPCKILSSSGSICTGPSNPGLIQNGENPITALCIGPSGHLYTSASDKVRIWDVRNYACLGKLSGGHQAAVMCVTAWRGPEGTDFVATGSKDHYVKVFEVPPAGGLVYPIHNLEPPHYDGVQSLAVDDVNAIGRQVKLFSGSRDSGIKRWSLVNGDLEKSLNNAHKGWVSGMAIAEQGLLTTCRGGFIRLWDTETCDSLAEIKTDSPINNVVTSGQLVYTCASSGEVRIWRFA